MPLVLAVLVDMLDLDGAGTAWLLHKHGVSNHTGRTWRVITTAPAKKDSYSKSDNENIHPHANPP